MKHFFLFSIFIFSVFSSWSQTTVGGIVKSETGQPVSFANIVFSNSEEGTVSNEDGKFYLTSGKDHQAIEISFVGYQPMRVSLLKRDNLNLEVVLKEDPQNLSEVVIYQGKTSKKNNPAIDILKKIWENRRENGVKKFDQYQYKKYEKLEFDLNTIDSSVITSRAFRGMEFIFSNIDTNALTGQTFLPVFLNESLHQVYGDNAKGIQRTDLLGNKNSGFNNNQVLIASIKDLYLEYDIYENYLRLFDKNFISPLSTTGIDNYNYVLADSAYIRNKWCYNIVYYPRRPNELTFKGDFWVNDTTWAIKKINLEIAQNANINWANNVFLEQEFEVINDSVFLLKRDYFMVDLSFHKRESARGIFGKKTVVYDDYIFDRERPEEFYDKKVVAFNEAVYNREEEFWQKNRLEPLNKNESRIYEMVDTLQTVQSFQRLYTLASIATTGYVEYAGWDFGPVYNMVGYNDVEGLRVRAGARTYFGQNDPWRIQGYGAYGFRDKKFKYGILGQVMLDPKQRIIVSGGYRDDIEQLGANLTNSTDVLGRSLASSSLLGIGDNDKLSAIKLSTFALQIEPVKNLSLRVSGSHRNLKPASPSFSLAWYEDKERNLVSTEINQTEFSTILSFSPGRETTGYGVERYIVNSGDFPTVFINYSVGLKDIFNSDFNYKKLQVFYDQPLWLGGIGVANVSVEAGKTFGKVPLGLLSVVPGNQSIFSSYNSFPLLDFYEFVTDAYVSAHFEHNFNGRLFSRIPLLRDLNLREIVGIRGVMGEISENNKQLDASGMQLKAPAEKPYWEYSVGVGNILKSLRIDAHFRGNYFDDRNIRTFGVTIAFGFHF